MTGKGDFNNSYSFKTNTQGLWLDYIERDIDMADGDLAIQKVYEDGLLVGVQLMKDTLIHSEIKNTYYPNRLIFNRATFIRGKLISQRQFSYQ